MTVPINLIRGQIDCRGIPCQMCGSMPPGRALDSCPQHGWTRGVLCPSCASLIAETDTNPTVALPRELFHRDNCPDCRRQGYAGVAQQIALPTTPHVTRDTVRRPPRAAYRHPAVPRRASDTRLIAVARAFAVEVGTPPHKLTRAEIRASAYGAGFSISNDRITRISRALRRSAARPDARYTRPADPDPASHPGQSGLPIY